MLLSFAVFSAVSGLELSMDEDQHKCRFNCFFNFHFDIVQWRLLSLIELKLKTCSFFFLNTQLMISVSDADFCRYIASNNMRDTGVLIRLATLRHTQGWVSFRTYCLLMASLHQHHRGVQHHPLEPPCVSSPFTILHV